MCAVVVLNAPEPLPGWVSRVAAVRGAGPIFNASELQATDRSEIDGHRDALASDHPVACGKRHRRSLDRLRLRHRLYYDQRNFETKFPLSWSDLDLDLKKSLRDA